MSPAIKFASLVLIGAALTACATQAEPQAKNVSETTKVTSTKTKSASVSSEAPEDRKVCKRTVPTGSRFAVKTCMTSAQWQELREQGKNSTSEFQRRSSQVGNPKGG